MTLDELIAALETEDPDRMLPLGFTNPHSYRGYYEQLAFEPAANASIGSMLQAARSALGATFEGWKGGDYTMGRFTDCHLAWRGRCGEEIGPVLITLLLAADQLDETTKAKALKAGGDA